jgi:hypothetical protein
MSKVHYVPGSGQTAYFIRVDFSPKQLEPPTIDDVWANQYSVIAWKITEGEEGYPEPVFIEEPNNDEKVFHLLPDGQVCNTDNVICPDLNSAKEDRLADAIGKWNQAQGDKS